jgi:hypothetical protein
MTKTLPDLPIHLWLELHGTSIPELRAYSKKRAELLTGLASAVRTRINGPLITHVGTSNARRPLP